MAIKRDKSEKEKRHSALISIIESQDLYSQDALASELKKKGFDCTQTTISRDLLELNVMKVGGYYRIHAGTGSNVFEKTFLDHTEAVKTAGPNLIIIKTRMGSANAVTIELDRLEIKDIAGTLAGDDTIFVAVNSKKEQTQVVNMLQKLLDKKN